MKRHAGRSGRAGASARCGIILVAWLAGCEAPEPALQPPPGPAGAAPPAAAEVVLPADPAGAPGPHGWMPVLRLPSEVEEVAIRIGGDGVTHALWIAAAPAAPVLLHASVASGEAEAADTVLAGWRTLESPRLLDTPSGLLAIFAGDPAGASPAARILAVPLPADGPAGVPRPVTADPDRTGGLAVTTDPDGAVVLAWPAGTNAHLAFGLEPRRPPAPVPACCSGAVALARDADGSLVLAGAERGRGLRTLTVFPADDAHFDVPASVASARAADGHFAATGLAGATGVFLAFCGGEQRCDAVRLWRHGAETAVRLGDARGDPFVAATPAGDGRLWVVWADADSLHAVRARVVGDAVYPGGRVDVGLPPSAGGTVALVAAARDAEGRGKGGPVQVVLAARSGGGVTLWSREVPPGLAVTPPAMPPPLDQDATLSLLVEDAGEPVPGARVRTLGRDVRTDARGVALLPLPAGVRTDTMEIHVEAAGYTPLQITLHGSRPEGDLP